MMKFTSTLLGLTLVVALSASDAHAAYPSAYNAFRPHTAPVAAVPYSSNYGTSNYGRTGCATGSCANGRCGTGVGAYRPSGYTTPSSYPSNGNGYQNRYQPTQRFHSPTYRSPQFNHGFGSSPYFSKY